ncbi:hypothetical protein NM208_g8034 [Fusarium decemcellulare]|uniref:Uncharacterized protein n=1 Tax=Fusarium decemcellulare TaxID=57161 RepID=A0ACC1S6Y0_9HYPO|nr:hypothetical protein NM208_g8034 [Fusarium decemcellulare]
MAPPPEANGADGVYHHHHQHQERHLSPVGAHLVAASGEFVGTFFFLYFGYAGNIMAVLQQPFPAQNGGIANSTVIWVAMSYGFSLLVNVWAFYRISGGLFNPAVTLGLCISGQLPWMRALFLFPAQLLGAIQHCAWTRHLNRPGCIPRDVLHSAAGVCGVDAGG